MAAPHRHDWYIQEWFATQDRVQFDLVTQLGYHRGTAHKLWHGLQPYRRDNVEEIAALLNIRPYELLMHPDDAMKLRRLQSVIAEVAKPEVTTEPAEAPALKTGTR